MPVRCSTGRSNSAPASVVICPPSKRATTSREKLGANGKQDWVHSVIAKAAFSLVLTAVWKLSYPMKSGFLPYFGEKSGLIHQSCPYQQSHGTRRPLAGAVATPRQNRDPVRTRGLQPAQHGHRVDAGGLSRRDLSGQQGHNRKQRHHRREDQRIGRRGPEKQGRDPPGDRKRRRASNRDADQRQPQRLRHHAEVNPP